MAFASTSWSYDGSPVSLRRDRRRPSPAARAGQRRAADASSPSPAEKHLADLQDAFLDAIERGSASLRSGHDDEQSRELRALSNIRLNMDELLSLLAKLRALDRQSNANKSALLSKINSARQELVTTIRMEVANVVYEQALVRQVLAFADLSDSDDSEAEPAQEASAGFSEYRAAAPAAAAPAPAPVPPPAGLRPIRVAAPKPEALPQPRSFTPLVRSARSEEGESPERVSPTSVLPPPRAASGNVYTYFDKNSGMLVTATVPMPTPAPVRVMPQLADSEEEDWDAPDRSFIAGGGAQAPPPPPVVVAATIVPPPLPAEYPAAGAVSRARKPAKAPRSRRSGGVHPLLGLLAAAAGVGLAVCGKQHVAAGAAAARSFVAASVEATRRMRAAAAAAERAAEDEPAMLHAPAAVAHKHAKAAAPRGAEAAAPPPPVTEWQLRPAPRPASAPPPPSEAPEAWRPAGPPGSVREVRWQPHVSLGRG